MTATTASSKMYRYGKNKFFVEFLIRSATRREINLIFGFFVDVFTLSATHLNLLKTIPQFICLAESMICEKVKAIQKC